MRKALTSDELAIYQRAIKLLPMFIPRDVYMAKIPGKKCHATQMALEQAFKDILKKSPWYPTVKNTLGIQCYKHVSDYNLISKKLSDLVRKESDKLRKEVADNHWYKERSAWRECDLIPNLD